MENLKLETDGAIATLTVNRPKKLNALNRDTLAEISESMDELADNDQVKVIILTGSGEKAFVAGADIAEFSDYSVEEGTDLSDTGHKTVFDKIANFKKPVIAAINGFALGGGLELAMAAHFRLASDNAKMGLPETSLGLIPGYGGTQRLPELIGKGRAMEMIMTAGMIGAEEAKDYGLVNKVTSQEELLPLSEKIASKISSNSTVAIAKAIEVINANADHRKDGYQNEIENFGKSFGTEDFKAGTQAFLNKEKADFPGK